MTGCGSVDVWQSDVWDESIRWNDTRIDCFGNGWIGWIEKDDQ